MEIVEWILENEQIIYSLVGIFVTCSLLLLAGYRRALKILGGAIEDKQALDVKGAVKDAHKLAGPVTSMVINRLVKGLNKRSVK